MTFDRRRPPPLTRKDRFNVNHPVHGSFVRGDLEVLDERLAPQSFGGGITDGCGGMLDGFLSRNSFGHVEFLRHESIPFFL